MTRAALLALCLLAPAVQAQDLLPGSLEEERAVYAAVRAVFDIPEAEPYFYLGTVSGRPRKLAPGGDTPVERLDAWLEDQASDTVRVTELLTHLTRPFVAVLPATDAGWRAFRQAHGPHARIIVLSRVGFDSTRTQAVLRISDVCGGRCGDRMTGFTLRKDSTGWHVTGRSTLVD
ncbi:hypothetical protein YTPLAS18_40360 [Nitrospira sp.]|nr:hypothetical protein YTPLAS18_40360 [Nitrospira sp.]